MKKFSFEKLGVWQDAKELYKSFYKGTKNFPRAEKFNMTSQIMRASLSVTNNIAEGSARTTKPDQSRFYTIAFGSLVEVLRDLIIAYELDHIQEKGVHNA